MRKARLKNGLRCFSFLLSPSFLCFGNLGLVGRRVWLVSPSGLPDSAVGQARHYFFFDLIVK